MPIYAYKCNECSTAEDYLVKFSDPVPACKSCGSTDQAKQINTGTGFLLKDYGWTKNGMNSPKVAKT